MARPHFIIAESRARSLRRDAAASFERRRAASARSLAAVARARAARAAASSSSARRAASRAASSSFETPPPASPSPASWRAAEPAGIEARRAAAAKTTRVVRLPALVDGSPEVTG